LDFLFEMTKGATRMKLKQTMKYQMDQFMAKGTASLVLMLFAVTLIAVVLLGFAAFFVNTLSGEPFLTTIWTSFMLTLDAGNLADIQGPTWYMVILTVSTMVGIFVTSMLISIISNGLQTKLEALQKGRSLVIENNHVLILGFNFNVPVIVAELVEANRNVRHPVIVILSEIDSVETLAELKKDVKTFYNTKVIIRTGSCYSRDDLLMCAIEKAKTVIVSHPDDADTIKALLAMKNTGFFAPQAKGYATTLFNSEKNLKIAQTMFGDKLEAVCLPDDLDRITAQTCLQPGLSFVYKNLLEFAGDEFYFYGNEKLVGKPVKDLIHMFEKSAFVGLFRNGKTMLNPAADVVYEQDDKVIVISEDDDTIFLDGHPEKVDVSHIAPKTKIKNKSKKNILAVGYNEESLNVLEAMCPYIEKGTQFTMITRSSIDLSLACKTRVDPKVQFTFINGDTTDYDVLNQVDYSNLDAIIIFSNGDLEPEKADSATLLTVLNIREIQKERQLDIPIIIEIVLNRNEAVLQYASVDDFIISNVLSNKLLCQISENRYLSQVFLDLFDEEGSEVYIKKAENYVPLNQPVNFYTVVESALRRNETAIGYFKKCERRSDGIILNPAKSDLVVFDPGDSIIVVAED